MVNVSSRVSDQTNELKSMSGDLRRFKWSCLLICRTHSESLPTQAVPSRDSEFGLDVQPKAVLLEAVPRWKAHPELKEPQTGTGVQSCTFDRVQKVRHASL